MPNPKPLRTTEVSARLPKKVCPQTDAIKVKKGNITTEFCAEINLHWFEVQNKLRFDTKKECKYPAELWKS